MPKIYKEVPRLRDFVKDHLDGSIFTCVDFNTEIITPHLEIQRGGETVAEVYDYIVVFYEDFEAKMAEIARLFESKYSTPERQISIEIYCQYREPAK